MIFVRYNEEPPGFVLSELEEWEEVEDQDETDDLLLRFFLLSFLLLFFLFFVLVKKQIGKMKMSEVVSWSFVSCEICPFLD